MDDRAPLRRLRVAAKLIDLPCLTARTPYTHFMAARELYLLSPYQVPSQNPLVLNGDDVAAFLNGYAALWHPAVIHGAAAPPRVVSPYDHEQPATECVYAVPDTPPAMLPDDWTERVSAVNATVIPAAVDRATTFQRLREVAGDSPLIEVPEDRIRPFLGIGFGYMMVNALYEAMEHENLLPVVEFWRDVQNAVDAVAEPDPHAFRGHLQAAADRLKAAREVLYPVTIHVMDIAPSFPQQFTEFRPAAFEAGLPMNIVASAVQLEVLQRVAPDTLAEIRERVGLDSVEICGGCYVECEEDLLPIESQVWNLRKGLAVSRDLLGSEVRVFARRYSGFHPQLPLVLTNAGLSCAIAYSFDDIAVATYQSTVVAFTSPDGRQVDGFARRPHLTSDHCVFFHLAYHLHRSIMQDHAATIALWHEAPDSPAYADWVELSRFGPVLGQWTTLSRYLGDVSAGEYASTMSPDDYHVDHLSKRVDDGSPKPATEFADHARQRRRMDTLYTLAAFVRGVTGVNDPLRNNVALDRLEALSEQYDPDLDANADFRAAGKLVMDSLAGRLLARAQAPDAGYLLLNPCSFARRVALELPPATTPLPISGPIKACQLDSDACRVVVEIPGLGFAWMPRNGPAGTPPMPARMRMADDHHVRNEFFEAEIDPATGGLRGIHDHHHRVHRVGQQLVFNPGSSMRATSVRVVSTGPALGEIVTEGTLVGEHDQTLARFRQRFRAWLGRPILELRIEIEPTLGPAGYAWHAYYAARFAWRDERAVLLRAINGTGYVTSHTRPQTPDYLELRQGRQNTVIFPGGLPFHQRHGARMLDVVSIPPGETGRVFDLAVGLDREHPMLTAHGVISPVPCLEVDNGPPHIGSSGWLFHIDSPNLLLTSLRPAENGDAVIARFLECGQHGGHVEMRFPREPIRAKLCDDRGERLRDVDVDGDRATFEVLAGELVQLHAEFS